MKRTYSVKKKDDEDDPPAARTPDPSGSRKGSRKSSGKSSRKSSRRGSDASEGIPQRIDDEFFDFLIKYKKDDECDPDLAKIIEKEFTEPTEDRATRLERAVQLPPMKNFIDGKLRRELRGYYLPPLTPPNSNSPHSSMSPLSGEMSPGARAAARATTWLAAQRREAKSLATVRRHAQRPEVKRRILERQAEERRADSQVIRLLAKHGARLSDGRLYGEVKKIVDRTAESSGLVGTPLQLPLTPETSPPMPRKTPQVLEMEHPNPEMSPVTFEITPPTPPAPKEPPESPKAAPPSPDAAPPSPEVALPGPEITEVKSFGQRFTRPSQNVASDSDTSDDDIDMDGGMMGMSMPARPPKKFKPKEPIPWERVYPRLPPKESVEADEADRGVLALKREGREWRDDSKYKGTRQPPLGIRLEHVLNFLREEDVDRSINWESELQEVVEYLEWLYSGDPDDQLSQCSLEVKNMFQDAVAKVKIHKEFEKFHYSITPLQFQKTTLPMAPKRLDWLGCQRDHPMRLTSKPNDPKLPIRYSVTRPIKPVNTMFPPGSAEGKEFRQKLWNAEESYWSGSNELTKSNMHFIAENSAYEKLAIKNIGWVLTDPSTGDKLLSDGSLILPNDEYSQCIERGARRAGFQQALRSFTAVEHAMTVTPWRRLHLPLEHSALERARSEADKNLFWEPFRLDRSEMPYGLETAPYTFWWREHAKKRAGVREKARKQAIEENGERRGWVGVPASTDCGGAFLWNRLDPDVNDAQLLLQKCELMQKLMDIAQRKSGDRRVLLFDLTVMCKFGADGRFEEGSREHNLVRFYEQDWETGQIGQRIKSLSLPDLAIFRTLALGTANSEMLVPLKEKGRLFNVFAKRVEKLMEDRGPDASFPEGNSQLDVEDLLKLINRGCDGPVRKTKFTVTDAMCWLPKLNEQGRLIFREDLACYGYVTPAYPDIYLEDILGKILDPEMAKDIGLAHYDWPPTHAEINRFLFNMAVRLGITLRRLRQDQAQWSKQQPGSTRSLLDSMAKCEAIYDKMAKTEKDKVLSPETTVWQAEPLGWRDQMPGDDPIKRIRSGIIEESTANLTMLGRGRPVGYYTAAGGQEVTNTRDHNWSWASKRLHGRPAPRFWSLDRWPVAFQSDQTAWRIRADAAVNQRVVWDPRAEDSTEGYPVRPKLRRYGEEEKVRFRPGPAFYSVGDTPLQQKIVQERITDMVAQAVGIDNNRPRTWGERLAGFFQASSIDEDMPDEPQLPKVDPSLMPVSWDPQSMPEARQNTARPRNV